MINKIIKTCKETSETVGEVMLIIVIIPLFLFWSLFGLLHGLSALLSGTD